LGLIFYKKDITVFANI